MGFAKRNVVSDTVAVLSLGFRRPCMFLLPFAFLGPYSATMITKQGWPDGGCGHEEQ